jgi:hypothetical protein
MSGNGPIPVAYEPAPAPRRTPVVTVVALAAGAAADALLLAALFLWNAPPVCMELLHPHLQRRHALPLTVASLPLGVVSAFAAGITFVWYGARQRQVAALVAALAYWLMFALAACFSPLQ